MMPIAEASTVHVPAVDRSAAPAPTLTTMWLWGFCHRYSSTTPRYVMFLPTSNIAREWWASVGAAARAIPTATAKASNGRRARQVPRRLLFRLDTLGARRARGLDFHPLGARTVESATGTSFTRKRQDPEPVVKSTFAVSRSPLPNASTNV